ncbi:hypothetical protein [Hymenobacter sp. UYP22]|uniref:hypothetical protein n=1 Tax=Hymenobacter sp. UYP22 TaxID=3156348 RepID=UPI003398B309
MSLLSTSALSIGKFPAQLQVKIKLTQKVPGPPPVPLPARQRITEQQAAARCRNHARSTPYHSGKRW